MRCEVLCCQHPVALLQRRDYRITRLVGVKACRWTMPMNMTAYRITQLPMRPVQQVKGGRFVHLQISQAKPTRKILS